MRLSKSVRTEAPVIGVAVFLVGVCNVAFWRHLFVAVAPHSIYEHLFLGGIAVLALCSVTLLLGLLALPYVFKPAATALLILAAGASYFASEYGTAIDGDMLRNILATNPAEVADLLSPRFFRHVVLLGIAPSVVLWGCTIRYRPLKQKIVYKGRAAIILGSAALLMLAMFSQNIMSVFRQHRQLLDMFAPLNVLSASGELVRKQFRSARAAPPVAFAMDAHKAPSWTRRRKKSVTVIVVGETARADNFSLNGYSRQTNPELSKVPDLISFTQAYSCGTSTRHSLPCMFSGVGANVFGSGATSRQEGLLDVLQRAGFAVLWRENQAGCYGVCSRVPTERLEHAGNKTFFELGEALDENLLADLQERIDGISGDAVIVLHMMGSHGPAYHKRYPPAFERFQPACKASQFSRCAPGAIVNSYDNTLVYSDFVLARLIEVLLDNDRKGLATAMLYLSDHGESLGESNLYLHGVPYALAPDVQKHIPFLIWLSPNYRTEAGVDLACLQRRRHEPTSHDNLFHSILGLLDVITNVYDRGNDLFARCRRVPAP